MYNVLKRKFEEGDLVYVVDYWKSNVTQTFSVFAEIIQVDNKTKTFTAVLNGNTFRTYSFKDYGRLIFNTLDEANKAVKSFPKAKKTVYQIINQKIYRRTVERISGYSTDIGFDLVLYLDNGKRISTKELGHSLFIKKSDAKKKNKKRRNKLVNWL